MKALPRPSGLLVGPVVLALALFVLPALAGTDFVYVADNQGAIYQYDVANGTSSLFVQSTQLRYVVGLVQEPSGDLLVSVVVTNAIWRIDHDYQVFQLVSQNGLLKNPDFMGIVGPEVFVADPIAASIIGVNRITGAQRTVVHGGLSNGGPWMCSGTDGFLYVGSNSNTTIVRVDPATGAESVVSSVGLLSDIHGIAYSSVDHFLYVCCSAAQRIVRVDPLSGRQKLIAQGGFNGNPFGVTVGPDGILWATGEASARLFRVTPSSGAKEMSFLNGMISPYGMCASGTASPPPPPPSVPISCSASGNPPDSVVVQWSAGAGQVDYFQVLRDGTPIATATASESLYVDHPPSGTHTYCVTAGNASGVSDAACAAAVTAAGGAEFAKTIVLTPRPNPSTSAVDFAYTVGSDLAGSAAVAVRLALYDVRGTLVRVLASGSQPIGRYRVHWDGNDAHGGRLGTGVYQYRLQVGTLVRSGKVTRL